jgi:tRNA threonylcarbamoyladenosine biosynthesis protein TsaB
MVRPRLAAAGAGRRLAAVTLTAPRILALDAALDACTVALCAGEAVLAEQRGPGGRGQVQSLAPMLQQVLAASGVAAADLDAVAVTIGPGSFTGLRASLALAHGLALASGVALIGVTVAEALAAALPLLGSRALWVAIDSRRGHVFLDRAGMVETVALASLPEPRGAVAVAGDAAPAVAARLAAAGANVMLTDARRPSARLVAGVAAKRLAGALPPLPVLPLYVDAPEARLPAAGLRPAPLEAQP